MGGIKETKEQEDFFQIFRIPKNDERRNVE